MGGDAFPFVLLLAFMGLENDLKGLILMFL